MSVEFPDTNGRPNCRRSRKALPRCSKPMFERPLLLGSTSSISGQIRVDKTTRLFAATVTFPVLLLLARAEENVLKRLDQITFPQNQPVAFVEQQFNRLLRDPVEQRGVVWLEGDGTMVMRVHAPRLEERRVEQSRLIVRRPSRPNDLEPDRAIAKAKPRYRELDVRRGRHLALWAAVQVLSGNTAAVQVHFAVSSATDEQHDDAPNQNAWALQLIPRDSSVQRELAFMRLYVSDNRLKRVYISHGAKQWRDMRFLHDVAVTAARPDGS